jgi:hypothetical protein
MVERASDLIQQSQETRVLIPRRVALGCSEVDLDVVCHSIARFLSADGAGAQPLLKNRNGYVEIVASGRQRLCQDRIKGVGFIKDPHALFLGSNVTVESPDGAMKIAHHWRDHCGFS